MTSVTFSNANSVDKRLYIADNAADSQSWCACFLARPLKATIMLTESWVADNNAVYLFSDSQPASESDFIKQLNAFLNNVGVFTNAFLWLSDTSALSDNTVNYLLATIKSSGERYTTNNTNILFGNYINLSVSTTCLVRLDSSSLFFKIDQQNGTIRFSPQVAPSQSQIVNKRVYISMTGASRGCVRFGINFSGIFDWNAYSTGLKYFYSDANGVQTISYPLLDGSYTATIPFQASLDPLNQFNIKSLRTFLAFNTGATQLPTYLRSDVGNALALTACINFDCNPDKLPFDLPGKNASLLVFSNTDKANTQPCYLLMQGGFHICTNGDLPAAVTSENLLCGLSGLETIPFNPRTASYAGDLLLFITRQPVYAPVFPVSSDQRYMDRALLTDDFLGAWVSVVPFDAVGDGENSSTIRYISQPTGASLYSVTGISTLTTTPFLGFYEPTTAYLEQGGTPVVFPMAFYGSFNAAINYNTDIALFENKIISPWRKITIEKAAMPRLIANRMLPRYEAVGVTKTSTTPQGLMVEIDEQTNTWENLILAKGQSKDENILNFLALNPRLQSAFQTNQQFLVIGLNKPLEEDPTKNILGQFNNTIQLEGWPFTLNVPRVNTYGQFNNVLIFKFCNGTVLDRVQNVALWTNQNEFNETSQDGLNTLSAWLTAYIKDGVSRGQDPVSPDPDFINFAAMVTNPDWNGILALKTDIQLTNFPSELQGLLAGIDLSQFNAHHFGINANHVEAKKDDTTGMVSMVMDEKSSMFGLIYYVDTAFAPYAKDIAAYKQTLTFNPNGSFDFKTLMLKVLFENSKIKSFKSYIQLSVYQLFGNAVLQTPGRDNILILSGSYEDHNGSPSYTFNGFDDDMIPVDNPVIGAVEVIRSNFSTLVQESNANMVYAQFALWGYLNFTKPTGMDALSFGSEGTITSTDGLAYSQMLIKMSFSRDTPAVKTFSFDVSEMSFDIAASRPRAESLYNHFPIKLTGLVSGDADNLPSNLNFVTINTPDIINAGVPSGPWYGLVYDLNLGTPGALAGAAGFKSSLLLAWSVTDGAVFAGLKLPGLSSQSKLLSLQSVLKIDIASVKLLMAKPDEDAPEAKAYLLMLNNITLKFLSRQFPSGGSIDFYLFGDPDAPAQPSSMGWYAAYQKKSTTKQAADSNLNLLNEQQ